MFGGSDELPSARAGPAMAATRDMQAHASNRRLIIDRPFSVNDRLHYLRFVGDEPQSIAPQHR
jgi:hypothetical protein